MNSYFFTESSLKITITEPVISLIRRCTVLVLTTIRSVVSAHEETSKRYYPPNLVSTPLCRVILGPRWWSSFLISFVLLCFCNTFCFVVVLRWTRFYHQNVFHDYKDLGTKDDTIIRPHPPLLLWIMYLNCLWLYFVM